jgi:hypothetical protein
MSKGMNSKKQTKKEPQKTFKEKPRKPRKTAAARCPARTEGRLNKKPA